MVPISGYYLSVTPPTSSGYSQRPQSMSHTSLPSATSAAHKYSASRQSLPAIRHSTPPAPANAHASIHEEEGEEVPPPAQKPSEMRHKSSGTMDRNFKFPPSQSQAQVVPAVPPIPPTQSPVPKPESEADSDHADEEYKTPVAVVAPSSVKVPPPPPIEKESHRGYAESEEGDEEVGETVEIDLR
jgi:chitin biosynthesis protein CHS5